jgi:uncharacterized protein Veg
MYIAIKTAIHTVSLKVTYNRIFVIQMIEQENPEDCV